MAQLGLLALVIYTLLTTLGILGQTIQSCSSLINTLQLPLNVKVLLSQAYPDNTTFQDPFSLSFPQPVPSLPAFCRVYVNISTSATSRTLFEVWLPLKGWNLRYMTVGNGGAAGGVNYPGLGVGLRAGFAVASTDTGHNSTVIDGGWLALGEEVEIDFGYRAVHLSTVYAKSITTQFYGKGIYHSYWSGCSSGGYLRREI
jgi:feruloyl esterase